jgi:hypothetical protein
MLWTVVRLVLALSLLMSATASVAASQPACTFTLGFATLHDLIPEIVGDCIDEEYHDPRTGDALQQTANGLLAWRKSDNWTAFTNGSRSWVTGPLGPQRRDNDERFSWEANPDGLAIIPTPLPGDRCHTAGLSVSLAGVDAGAGNFFGTFLLTNNLDVDCTFFGYPGAQLLDEASNPMPTTVVRDGGFFANNPPPATFDVPAHTAAMFQIHWEQVPVGDETTCSLASSIAITPPDEYVSLSVPAQIRACGGGHLDISAVQDLRTPS